MKFLEVAQVIEYKKWPQDIIVEIIDGPDQILSVTEIDKWERMLKNVNYDIETYPLYAIQIGNGVVFALKKDNEFITFLFGDIMANYPNKEKIGVEIGRSYTPPKFRGNGYSPALYDGLVRAGYALVSDKQLSQSGKAVWDKLKRGKGGVKAFDIENNQYSDLDPKMNPKIRYVLEQEKRRRGHMLMDSIYYTGGYPKKITKRLIYPKQLELN